MLKNIWYCIKKTFEWYFALLVLYIILTLVNATIPILSAFLPKLVIEKLTLGSDIKGGIIRMCEQVAASGNTLILYSA